MRRNSISCYVMESPNPTQKQKYKICVIHYLLILSTIPDYYSICIEPCKRGQAAGAYLAPVLGEATLRPVTGLTISRGLFVLAPEDPGSVERVLGRARLAGVVAIFSVGELVGEKVDDVYGLNLE